MSTVFGGPAGRSPERDEGGAGQRPPAGNMDEQAAAGPGAPGHGARGYGEPGYAAAPGYGEPGHGEPGYGAAGYGAAGYGGAAQETAGSAYGAGAPGGSGWPGPGGHGGPGSGAPGYGGPGYGTAGYGAPGYGEPGYGGPGYGTPGHGGPGYGEPGYGGPGYGTPGHGGPGYGAPGGGSGDGPRRGRRRRLLLGGAAIGVAAALAFTGLSVAEAMSPTVLTTAQIAAKVSPAVVDIYTNLGYQNGQAAGTGMVLSPSGEVLTNNHVIDGATSIRAVDVGNGRTYTAKVVGYDKTDDVAVIQLQKASGLKTVTLSSSAAKVGDKVVALGNAGGKGGAPSVAAGKVTGLGVAITAADQGSMQTERLTGMTRTNVPIRAGDSGGPLLNTAGEVVGMNTAASASISTTGFSSSGPGQTQAFAIPVAKATAIADQIEAGKASAKVHIGETAFLGVEVSSSGPGNGGFGSSGGSAGGATVVGVVPGAAAAQAGVTAGDEITSVAGRTITSPSEISSVLLGHHPGDKITIGWTDQSGQAHTATVTLTTGPAD